MELLEIFEEALALFKKDEYLGMCSVLNLVTRDRIGPTGDLDFDKAHAYLEANRPTTLIHPEFYKFPNYVPNGVYWWSYSKVRGYSTQYGREIRIQFLEKLITQLKNEQ